MKDLELLDRHLPGWAPGLGTTVHRSSCPEAHAGPVSIAAAGRWAVGTCDICVALPDPDLDVSRLLVACGSYLLRSNTGRQVRHRLNARKLTLAAVAEAVDASPAAAEVLAEVTAEAAEVTLRGIESMRDWLQKTRPPSGETVWLIVVDTQTIDSDVAIAGTFTYLRDARAYVCEIDVVYVPDSVGARCTTRPSHGLVAAVACLASGGRVSDEILAAAQATTA